jgi:pseudouridylate synthase
MSKDPIHIHPSVAFALEEKKPIVSLESTLISHGMPYPLNLKTALSLEEIIRKNGAVPATIGIIEGKIKVGLTPHELEFMASSPNIPKVSRRDLPFVLSRKLNGATTVASTMIVSSQVGISVFVTGGIGGVHRNAKETFDISADLLELAKTDVAVVCAGVKSILDIGLTLEYLETQGVPVIGYKTNRFPAFFTRDSGFEVPCRVDSPIELAHMIKTKWDFNLSGGLVIANPIPEKYAMDEIIMKNAIDSALAEAETKHIRGKDITPFLLSHIKETTEGNSLKANIELVLHNAKLGAKLAVSLNHLRTNASHLG